MIFWRLRILTFYIVLSFFALLFAAFFCVPAHYLRASYNVRYKISEVFSYIFIFLARFICSIKYEVIGIEKLPKFSTPYLILANHQSFWENLFMQLIIPKHSWVLKKELFDIPVFGWCLRIVDPIAIDRRNRRSILQILEQGKQKIDQGLPIVIFPEGGTVKINKNVRFKPSAAKLAISNKVPIILIAHNSGVFWPKGFWFRKPGLITVKILEIIYVKDYQNHDARSLTHYIESKINEEKENLVKKAEEQYLKL